MSLAVDHVMEMLQHAELSEENWEELARRVAAKAEVKPDHTFRVVHEYGGRVAYEGASYIEAATEQTNRNLLEQSEGRPPKWRLWLIDPDGIGVIVKTQVE